MIYFFFVSLRVVIFFSFLILNVPCRVLSCLAQENNMRNVV